MTSKEQDNAYCQSGEHDKTIADCSEAIRLDQSDASAYYRRGTAYCKKGEYDKAIADYSEAMRLNPGDASAYYERASAYYKNGEYDKAIADYTEITRLDPDDFIAYCNRASTYYENGNYNKAIADYTEAIRLVMNPDMADDRLLYETIWDVELEACDIYQARAQVYIAKKNFGQAVIDLEEALELEPGDEDIKRKLKEARNPLRERIQY